MCLTYDTYIQGNILITRDGNACLGDFGITTARRWLPMFKLGTIRYMAPERLGSGDRANLASKESDVYSFAMTSFTVRSTSVGKQNDT